MKYKVVSTKEKAQDRLNNKRWWWMEPYKLLPKPVFEHSESIDQWQLQKCPRENDLAAQNLPLLFNLTLVMKTEADNRNPYPPVFTGHGFLNVLSSPFFCVVQLPGHL